MTRNWSVLKLKLVVACLAALGMLAMSAGVAGATVGYVLVQPEFPASGLPLSIGVTVDNSGGPSGGNVFAVGYEGNFVRKFDKEGNDVSFTELPEPSNEITGLNGPVGLAVSPAGELFVANEAGGTIQVFDDTTGKSISYPAGSFTHGGTYAPFGIAFDTSTSAGDPSKGDVYISDHANKVVNKFKPNGEFISSLGATELNAPQPDNIAVDGEGNVYVNNRFGSVFKYGPTGTLIGSAFTTNPSQALAIDSSTGHLFIKEEAPGAFVQEYDSTGTKLGQFGAGHISSSYAMAVNSTTHAVYISNIESGKILRFEAGEGPPAPKVLPPATEVKGNHAELHGELNPGGAAGKIEYHFAFYTEGTCAAQAGITGVTPTETAEEAKEKVVAAVATGLTPETTYKYCLVSSNPFGSTPSVSEDEFKTTAGAPVIESQLASEETTTTAKVTGTINASGASTTCKVEYGLTEAYGKEVACPTPLEGTVGVPVTIELTGLEPGKEYNYRFVATNAISEEEGGEPPHGSNATFKSKPLVVPKTEAASAITPETVTLNGHIKTGTEPAHYYFVWGKEGEGLIPNEGKPNHTTEVEVAAEQDISVSANLNGLAAGTGYEYELVAVTPGNEHILPEVEPVKTFSTLVSKPVVTNKPTTNITRTSASVAAEINTENSETEYSVEYGEKETYGESTSLTKLTAAVGASQVSQAITTGLHAGTTYHYRFVATNGTGTTNGPDGTFTTAKPQLPIVESESSAQETQTTATINGTINASGLQTTYILEVGTELEGHVLYTPSFGEVGSAVGGVQLTFGLTNLLPGTTYHYRFVAQNEDGTVVGEDKTFATGIFAPVIIPPAPVQIIPTPPQPKEEKPHIETRAEKYKHAVALCKKGPKKKRAACMRRAKKKFGPVKKKGKKK